MANTLAVDQVNTVLRAVLSQSTGKTDLAPLDTAQLLTIGQKQLLAGEYEPVLKGISQVMSRTIFSIRKYSAKMSSIRVEAERWGNYSRKLKIADKETDIDENKAYKLVEGAAVDQYQVDGTNVVQLNFYGQQTYTVDKTIFKDQLNTAFSNASEFAQFISMILTYVANKIEKIHEDTGRATIAGLIAGIVADAAANDNKDKRVVHLVTEFTAETGLPAEGQTIYTPGVFEEFVRWTYAKCEDIAAMMSEFTQLYQTNLTGLAVNQHTPAENAVAFFYAPFFRQATTRVLSETYHDQFLKLLPRTEMVNFWQSAKGDKTAIDVTHANYLNADGTITDGGSQKVAKVFGVIMDDTAACFSPILDSVDVSPYNAAGKYWNYFWHFNERHSIDMTEKAVVLLLD